MRTYGRQYNSDGTYQWVEVSTAPNGDNSQVYLTTLIQCLNLNLGESPFWANYGIPIMQTLATQVYPDYYLMQLQAQFAPFFATLTITRVANTTAPYYKINITTFAGGVLDAQVPY